LRFETDPSLWGIAAEVRRESILHHTGCLAYIDLKEKHFTLKSVCVEREFHLD
jgi:hypothetical protein